MFEFTVLKSSLSTASISASSVAKKLGYFCSCMSAHKMFEPTLW